MPNRRCLIAIAVGVALAVPTRAANAQARTQPSDDDLIYAGLSLAFPTYVLGVATHEYTHALTAKLLGAEVLSVDLTPGRHRGAFHFGLTRVRGLNGAGERVAFYLAPKAVDVILLGGYAGLLLTDGWPDNRYAQLTLTVLATGWWVDFSKDVLSFRPANDVNQAMKYMGLPTERQRWPVRVAYAAASIGLGWLVWRGYQRTFASDPAEPAERAGDTAPDPTLALTLFTGRF